MAPAGTSSNGSISSATKKTPKQATSDGTQNGPSRTLRGVTSVTVSSGTISSATKRTPSSAFIRPPVVPPVMPPVMAPEMAPAGPSECNCEQWHQQGSGQSRPQQTQTRPQGTKCLYCGAALPHVCSRSRAGAGGGGSSRRWQRSSSPSTARSRLSPSGRAASAGQGGTVTPHSSPGSPPHPL